MRGNRIERNVFYYPDQPDSVYVKATNCNLEHNTIDHNIVWNGGTGPVKTGRKNIKSTGPDVTGLIPNHDFTETAARETIAKDPSQTVAAGWTWYHKTLPDMVSEIVETEGESKGLCIDAAFNPELKYIKYACIRSKPFQLTPGTDFALSFNLRSFDADGPMIVRCVPENKGLWKRFGQKTFNSEDGKTTECRTSFHSPAPARRVSMNGSVRVRFNLNSSQRLGEPC